MSSIANNIVEKTNQSWTSLTCQDSHTDNAIAEPRTGTGVTGSDLVKPTELASKITGHDTTSGDNYTTGSDKYTGTTAATKIAPLEDNYDPAGGVNPSGTEYKPISSGSDSKATSGTGFDASSRYTENTASTNMAPLEDNYNPAGGINTSGTEYKPISSGNDSKSTSGTGLDTFSRHTENTDNTSDTEYKPFSSGSDFKSTSDTDASRYTENTANTKLPPLEDNYNPAGGNNTSGTEYKPVSSGSDFKSTGSTHESRDVNTSGRDKTSSSAGPHKEFGSSVKAGKDMSSAQQDVRDPSDPQTDPKEAAIKSNVDDTGDGLDVGDNPDKVDGPGPRPLIEVAKEHGGDAGNTSTATGPEKRGGAEQRTTDNDEEGDGPQKTSSGEGTGEQYVKSSGLKADGGDFDATNPGAGREADRMFNFSPLLLYASQLTHVTGLMETKGVHREAPKPAATATATADDDATHVAGGEKEKKSLGEKIKEKLHHHKH